MTERAWRKTQIADALARDDLRRRARQALAAGPLCDACLGRLFAQVDTGLTNTDRGRQVRRALATDPSAEEPKSAETPPQATPHENAETAPSAETAPPAGPCRICHGLFDSIDQWAVRAEAALRSVESRTFQVASHVDPAVVDRERALWDEVGGALAEPYKTHFNRLLGTRLWEATGREPDLVRPEVVVLTDHRTGRVRLRIEPLLVAGRYRKLVRGLPQCRWKAWPTSIQDIVGEPIRRAADGNDTRFHGCGREDTDVRCLGRRPFILEVRRPKRRRLDWAALAAEINASGQVEVDGLASCARDDVARIKGLRPDKSYRAVAELAEAVDDARLAHLADLVGLVRQRTPVRVLKRRANRLRRRRVRSLEWKRIGPRQVELTVRAQAGTYIKELVSGDGGRTRPSVAEVLGTEAVCVELDVIDVHVDNAP